MENSGEAAAGPRILGRYAVYDAIASGGMATVHYGRLLGPVGFSRTVAIKRLHPQFAQDPQFVTMFLDEARLAGRIRHPNVVATLDVVATANEIFLVMDYVHGEALSRIIREVAARDQLVPLPVALRIATDALQGLHAAHEARDEKGVPLNIVHRDISPQNILVGVDGTARLVDFGVAKATGQGQTTREGTIKGKLGYMSPEQLRGAKVTRQSDVHAFAVVLWELLTGRRLFAGATEADTIAKAVQHQIVPASSIVPGLPAEVDRVLAKGLADSLDDRYATARDMCIALEACGEIASTMAVADWVQAQIHDLLARRSAVVSSIESGSHELGAGAAPADESSSAAALNRAVARLSNPELGPNSKSPTLFAQPADGAADTGISAVVEEFSLSKRPPPWVAIGGIAFGLVGLLAASFALGGRHADRSVASDTTASGPASATSAPAAIPVQPVLSATVAASAPPLASAEPSAAPPLRPAVPPSVAPPAARAPGARPTPPRNARPASPANHDDVFNSRE